MKTGSELGLTLNETHAGHGRGPALTIYNQHLSVLTDEAVGFTDVTEQLVAALERSGVKFRLPNLQTKHTTTGLMSAHLTTRLRSKAG